MVAYFKRWSLSLACVILACAWGIPARANPEGGVVSAGAATITETGSRLDVHQASDRTVIDWRGFNIAPSETTQFHQPSSSALAVNRVNATSASHIDGTLTANGNIVIINQNGVIFGRGSRVDANSLIATTADTTNADVMAGGKLKFTQPGNPNAQIVNEGTITAKDAGLVGLVAPTVINDGVITANLGRAQLASGDTATVDLYGDGLLEVAVSDQVHQQLVSNTGHITANGGKIALTAAAGKAIVNGVVHAGGTLTAQTVATKNGEIIIASAGSNHTNKQGNSEVMLAGVVDVSGRRNGEKGGKINVTGDHVLIASTASLIAEGQNGGGTIHVGGDYQGLGTLPNAKTTTIEHGAIIDASSIGYGNGGEVIVWSDNGTSYDGHIDVSASAAGGNGGFIEVSGKDWLRFAGSINASAPAGLNGSLLLDPADITISNAANSNITGATPFQSTGAAASNLNVGTLQTALGAANVTITSAAGAGGLGNITFIDPVLWNSANSLTVTASNNITVNSTITNAGSGSITLNANVAATGDIAINSDITTGGSITMLAKRDIVQAVGTTLTTGAAGGLSLRAANASTAGTGNLTLGGVLSVGNGALTLLSGVNGTRPSWSMDTTSIVPQTGTFGAITITGFQDLTVNRNVTSSGAITMTAMRDLSLTAGRTIANGAGAAMALSAANGSTGGSGNLDISGILAPSTGNLTLVSGANGTRPSWTITGVNIAPQGASIGAISVTGFQDLTVNTHLTSSGNITMTAMRDLTLGAAWNLISGAAGLIDLRAANGAVAGTGNLNMNGNLSAGTGGVTLRSGINGTRPSLTLDATNLIRLGATFGAVDIQGLYDLTINRDINSSGAVTMLAYRDFVLNAANSIASGAASALSLQAAGASTAGTGNLNINGNLSSGTGALTLLSGINGTRPTITLDTTKLVRLGATFGTVSITGFNDVTVNRDINSSGSITITTFRDLTLNAARTLTTGAAGAFNLQAANGVVTGTGNLTLNGNLSAGSGAVTMRSGINGTRPSWTMDGTTFVQQGATVGAVDIQGFQDMTINRNLTSSGAITVVTQRDLTLSGGNTVTTGAASALNLSAANASVAGTGNLTLSGNLASGTGNLTLISGVNGTRPSWTADATTMNRLGATFGVLSIQGFQDLTINRNMNSTGNVTMLANRDLTLSAGNTITTGAANNLSLRAANGVITGTGNLTLNGNLAPGTGTVLLYSGVNGTRANWTMDATTFAMQGATTGATDIQGLNDITVDRNLTSTGAITLLAYRDLTLNAARTVTPGAASGLSMQAAGGATGGTGKLNLNGAINAGTGGVTLLSGINGTRPTWTADATTLLRQGATFGAINWQGFANIIIDRPLNSSSTVSFTNNTLTTISDDISSTGTMTFGAATAIDQGVTANLTSTGAMTFSTTLNGTAGGAAENVNINTGTGTLTFTGIVGGTTPLGNLSITADNLTLSANLNGTGNLSLKPTTAGRAVNTGTASADNITTAGFNLSNNETGRIVNGWNSITIGSLTTGDFTNSRAAWSDPVTFLSGNDFINATAIATADPVFVQAVRDVTINQNIASTNTTANAIVLVAGRNFVNNKGAGSLTTGGGGRWLVYSTDPTGSTGEQLLVNAFNRYTCTYGGTCPALGTGNGFLYSYTPTITVSISGQTYTYGDAVLAPGGYTLVTSNYLNALDSAQDTITGTGNFTTTYVQGDHAGSSYSIVDNGSTLASTIGYGFTISTPTGTVQQRAITVTASDQTHTYGFGGLGTAGYSITAGSLYGTDAISGVTLATNATLSGAGQYNANGTPWTLSASAANFSSGLGSDYDVTYANAPTGLTITPRALAVTATGINKVYDGLTTASVTYGDDRLAGDVLSAAGTAAFTTKDVANGKTVNVTGIGLSGADSGNYSANATTSTTADITPAALTITANNHSMTYGAGNTFNGFTPTGLQNGETIGSVTFGTNATTSSSGNWNYSAAPWTITASAATGGTFDINNYTVTYAPGTLTIGQKALTITATGVNKVYDGLTGATVTYGDDRVAGDLFTAAGTAAFTTKDVANGKTVNVTGISISGADAANYSYNSTASTTADITPASLTITANNHSMTYGAGNTFNGFTPTGLQNGETVGSVTFGTNATTSSSGNWNANAAPWTITASAATGGTFDINNYTVTYAPGTLTITPRALAVTATGINKVYDGLTGATVTYGDDRIASDLFTVSGTAAFTTKDVANGKTVNVTGIGLSGIDAANYTPNSLTSTTADITPAALTVTANNKSMTYGAGNTFNGFTPVGLQNGETIGSVTFGTNATTSSSGNWNANAAPWTITASGATGGTFDINNYTVTYAPGTLTITPKTLTITATGINKVYDGLTTASVTYGDDRLAGDVLSATGTAAFTTKDVANGKTVNVTGIGISGADSGNYSANATTSTTADITPAALTITANNKSMTYDAGNTFNGFTPTGLQNGETVGSVTFGTNATTSSSGNWNANGAPWTITASAATGGTFDINNYTVTYAPGTLTITPRALAVTATGVNKVYNGLTNATVTYGDDRIASDVFTVSGTAAFTTKDVANGKTVNVSGIGLSGIDAANYTANSTTSTTADITPAALTITANNKTMVYGAGNTFNGFTPTGLQNGETVGSVTFGTNATSSGSGNWNAGSWAITANAATGGTFDIDNYTVTYAPGTLTITPRALSLATITAADKPYDGTWPATITGYTLGGSAMAGDVLSVTGLTGTFVGSNTPGVRMVIPTAGSLTGADAVNYSFTLGPVFTSATITPSAMVPPPPPPTSSIIPGTVAYVSQNGSVVLAPSGQGAVYTLTYIAPPSPAANVLQPVGVGRAFFYVPTAELFDYDKPEDNNFMLPYLEESDI